MRRILLSACVVVFISFSACSQDIFIAVYKGEVSLSDGTTLSRNFKYTLPKNSSITFPAGSYSIIFTNDRYFEKKVADNDQIISPVTYAQIVKAFNNLAARGQGGFSDYLKKLSLFSNELQSSSVGSVVAGIRAADDGTGKIREKNEPVFPMDSARLLTGKIHLRWQLENKLFGTRLIVINTATGDTVHNSAASNKGAVDVDIDKQGTYNWFIYSKLEKKKHINRVFIKPDAAGIKKIRDALEDFKKQTTPLSEELRSMVLDDYLFQNNILED